MKYWVIIGEGGGYEEVKKLRATDQNKEKSAGEQGELERRVLLQDEISFTQGGKGKQKIFVNGKEEEAPDLFMLWGHYNEMQEGINDTLLAMGAKSVNPIEGKRIVCSKLKTASVLDRAGIPQARTMIVGPGTDPDFIISELGLPVVVKPSDGAQGQGVLLMETKEALSEFLAALPQKLNGVTLAQQFISTSRGRDVRVYVIDHKYRFSIMRIAGRPEEFRSNIHAGGRLEVYPIDEKTQKMCEKVSRVTGLRVCGIDLLLTENGYVVGEVNCTPGMPDEFTSTDEFRRIMKNLVMDTLKD